MKGNHDGNLFWYGLALRDHHIEAIKQRQAMINRYPLMDVSFIYLTLSLAFCKKEHFLRHYQQTITVLPKRLSFHA